MDELLPKYKDRFIHKMTEEELRAAVIELSHMLSEAYRYHKSEREFWHHIDVANGRYPLTYERDLESEVPHANS